MKQPESAVPLLIDLRDECPIGFIYFMGKFEKPPKELWEQTNDEKT